MRIDFVNGATYSPSQIAENRRATVTPKHGSSAAQAPKNVAPKAAMENLTPAEANLLQKLFGDFKMPDKQDLGSPARTGMFVDITV
jgi:hypothetical protein